MGPCLHRRRRHLVVIGEIVRRTTDEMEARIPFVIAFLASFFIIAAVDALGKCDDPTYNTIGNYTTCGGKGERE
jgi:hypothetical protein